MLETDRNGRAIFNTMSDWARGDCTTPKVNPWIPWEVHTSPHDIDGYDEALFPVAQTPIGNIGAAICYDWLFPETLRQLTANGAEILVRVSAYMDPFGSTEPMDWWTVVNRCRALENLAYVVAANQGASLKHYPPFSWPGGSMVVDYDGRLLAQASPGPGERIVVAAINVEMLRYERKIRRAHQMLAHLRTECYPLYRQSFLRGMREPGELEDLTVTEQELRIDDAKRRMGYLAEGKHQRRTFRNCWMRPDRLKMRGSDLAAPFDMKYRPLGPEPIRYHRSPFFRVFMS
jgi:hypothetical protein